MSLDYKDPDGNFVELQSDNFSDWKLSGEHVQGSPNCRKSRLASFLIQPASTRLSSPGPISDAEKAVYAGGLLPDPIPISVCRAKGCYFRFGSKADMCSAKRHVRSTPASGR